MSILKNFLKKVVRVEKEPLHQHHGFSDPKLLQIFNYKSIKIPENNQKEKILVRDLRGLKGRLRNMKRMGLKNFSIVSDFDQTLTKCYHDGNKVVGTLGMFKSSPSIKRDVQTKLNETYEEMKNLENEEEKLEESQQLLEDALKLVSEEQISKNVVQKLIDEAYIIPRSGFDTFLHLCYKYDIPFYLISAGVSNVIASILSKYINFENYPNFHLYSNEMVFDEKDILTSFKGPYLHFTDKIEIFNTNRKYSQNILLLGDHLQDVHLAKNMRPKSTLKIGYFNFKFRYDSESVLEKYASKYDIVIVNDGSLSIVEQIVKYILDLESEQVTFNFLEEHIIQMPQALKEVYNIKKDFLKD